MARVLGRARGLLLAAAVLLAWGGHVVVQAATLRRVQGKAEVKRVDLGVGGRSGPSIADHMREYFLVDFTVDLPAPVNDGWNITLVTNRGITMVLNLEADLVDHSADNRTTVYGPKLWNRNLPAGRLWQSWQGVCDGPDLAVTESYLTYDPSIAQPSPVPKKAVSNAPPGLKKVPEPVKGEKYNLAKSLALSGLFYEAQRSGKMPANKRVPWRFDSELNDKGLDGEDLTGGWHDAGDHIKFAQPLGAAVSTLNWGGLEFEEGYRAAGELGNLLDSVKWPLDWMIKAHVKPDEMYVQVSDKPTDHFVWTRPEDMTRPRRAYKVTCDNPGSQPVLDSAAALASGAVLFKKHYEEFGSKGLYGKDYADTLLQHAEQLFDFGTRCPGHYVRDGKVPADCCYSGGGWEDEEAWAALWLYQATGKQQYLDHAKATYDKCCAPPGFNPETQYGWDNKEAGVNLLLYKLTQEQRYKDAVTAHVNGWAWKEVPGGNFMGKQIQRTPKGLAYIAKWGSLRVAANEAFVALVAAQAGINPEPYRAFAKGQVYYILGDCCLNEQGESIYTYQMGFGPKHPRSPHHRATSCDDDGNCECSDRGSYHILYGAIVGGPTEDDYHYDKCGDFITNEVAVDYNAGFQGAVAGLKQLSAQGLLGDDK